MAHLTEAHGEGWVGHGLTITISKRDALRAGVRLVGELDLASVALLEACLENLRATGSRYIRVDLSALAFVDCAGLGGLLEAHHAFLRVRGTMVITGVNANVRRVMGLANVYDVLFVAAESPALAQMPVA